jgi:hypothetical protein
VGQKSTRETTRKQGFPSSGWSARRCLPKLRDKKRAALAWQAARRLFTGATGALANSPQAASRLPACPT